VRRGRERGGDIVLERDRDVCMYVCMCVYTYVYIVPSYIYISAGFGGSGEREQDTYSPTSLQKGRSPLWAASFDGHATVVEHLIAARCNVDLATKRVNEGGKRGGGCIIYLIYNVHVCMHTYIQIFVRERGGEREGLGVMEAGRQGRESSTLTLPHLCRVGPRHSSVRLGMGMHVL
jgi:hypothetical protein